MIARREIYLLIALAIAGVISACGLNRGTKSALQFFPTTNEQLQPLINQLNGQNHMPKWPLEKSLYNEEYPIELALYQDGIFYYNLPRLGSGSGTWSMEQGALTMKAQHKIDWMDFTIDMDYQMGAGDGQGKTFHLKFTDRFGPKDIELAKRNIH